MGCYRVAEEIEGWRDDWRVAGESGRWRDGLEGGWIEWGMEGWTGGWLERVGDGAMD